MKKNMIIIIVTLMTVLFGGFAIANCHMEEPKNTTDTTHLSFSFSIIGVCDSEFTIVYDEDTEELVCVRFSKEIGPRMKVSRNILDDYLRFSHSKTYFPYFIENEKGISFNIHQLMNWSEEKRTDLQKNIGYSNATFVTLFTYSLKCGTESTFSDSKNNISSFWVNSSSKKTIMLNSCTSFEIDVFPSFEDIQIEKVTYRLEDLQFKLVFCPVANSNLKHLYAYAKIDDTHYTILDIAPSKELEWEPTEKYLDTTNMCEIPGYFRESKKIDVESFEKTFVMSFQTLTKFLETL